MVKSKKSPKKTQKTRAKHLSKTDTHIMVRRSLSMYAVVVFLMFWLVAITAFMIDRILLEQLHSTRYKKISNIYTSLNLGDSYRIADSNIFGDKRVYDWDKSRTRSSSVEYGRNSSVKDTIADATEKIKKAGFSHIQTEYENSLSPVYEFKNDKGNYIRLQVIPDAAHDDALYGTNTAPFISTEQTQAQSPSYVTIKVNLDDNNE